MKQLVFSLSLFAAACFSNFAHAYEDVLFSPVGVVDYAKYGALFLHFDERQDVRALREVSYILYDPVIRRPWGDKYLPAVQSRWNEARSQLCTAGAAGLREFCGLPSRIGSDLDVAFLLGGLARPEVNQEL